MREKINLIYSLLFTFFLTITHLLELSNHFKLHINAVFVIVLTLVFVCYLYALRNFRGKQIYQIISAASLVLLFAGGIIAIIRIAGSLMVVVDWCRSYNGSAAGYHALYAYIVIVVMMIFITGLIFLLVSGKVSSNILAVVYLGILITFGVLGYELSKFTILVLFAYILNSFSYICGYVIHRRRNILEHNNTKVYLLPVCILFILLLAVLPVKSTPIQWAGIKKMVQSVSNYVNDIAIRISISRSNSNGLFTINMTGYSEDDKELGGELSDNNKVALTIKADRANSMYPLYLIGTINDSYTGSRWERADGLDCPIPEYFLNYMELYFTFGEVQHAPEYELAKRDITITYNDLISKSLFLTNGTRRLTIVSDNRLANSFDTNLTFKKFARKGASFRIQYEDMNLSNEALQKRIIEQENFRYTDVDVTTFDQCIRDERQFYPYSLTREISETLPDMTGEQLKKMLCERAETIRNDYTKLPDTVPQRVYDLANEITKDYSSQYEKLKAIEAYVSSYTYKKRSSSVKDGEDFVDHFLFEEQEGYCTSFASAMAVLARCIGIPTRYVEGFLCDFQSKPNDMAYSVESKDAHAWVEAYFEGLGWIAFEPTSGYLDNRYPVWEIKKEAKTVNYTKDIDLEKYRQEHQTNQQELQQKLEESKKEGNNIAMILFFGAIGSCIALIGIMLLVIRIRYRYKYIRLSREDKAELLYMRALSYLSRQGVKRSPEETLHMYAKRVKQNLPEESEAFDYLTKEYEKICYGEREISEEGLKAFWQFVKVQSASFSRPRERMYKVIDDITYMMRI